MSRTDYGNDDDQRWLDVAVTGCAAEPDDPSASSGQAPQPVTLIPHTDAAKSLFEVSYALERLVEQQANVAFGYGVHPALCEATAYQIRRLWEMALRTVKRDPEAEEQS